MTVGEISIWTPSGLKNLTPRVEKRDSPIFTPFFVKWNGGIHASFYFESKVGASMPMLYRLLFAEMAKLRENTWGPTLAVVMLAEAKKVVDKAMAIAPTRQNAPANNKLITDETNIDVYFRWNLVQAEQFQSQAQSLIVIGVGLDVQPPNLIELDEVLEKAFYVTPGTTSSVVQMLHNHAVALRMSSIPFDELIEGCVSGQVNPAVAASDILKRDPSNVLQMVHIENDTLIHRALVGVGVIDDIAIRE